MSDSLKQLRNWISPKSRDFLSDVQLRDLEKDAEVWAKHFYPTRFSRPSTGYQKEFYAFAVTMEADKSYRPRVECEPRGVGKSSIGRALIIYLLAKRVKFYVLYVSATAGQAKKHFNAIKKMLEDPKLLAAYPHLRPQERAYSRAIANWSAQRLVTQDGQVVEFVSVLGNARGFNTEEGKRLDLIIIDDADDQKDSADIVEKKLDIIGSNILGAGDESTDVWWLQNLIHRISMCTRLRDNTAGILLNRQFVGPYPLCKQYEYVEEKIEGDTTGARYLRMVDFQPFDPATSKEYAEKLLNQLGPKRFERECQQNLSVVDDDKDFREWSEVFHVITYQEFYEFFKKWNVPVYSKEHRRLQIPSQWNVGLGMDFGTTPGHPTAVMPLARPNKAVPLHDSFFCFGEVVLPKYPHDVNKPAELVSPGRVAAAERAFLKRWGVREEQIHPRTMSHEQSAALNAMAIDLPDDLKVYYHKWKAKKGSGVPQWQNIMEIDYTKPHPFRKYPKNHPDKRKAGKPLMGCPRYFVLVPPDQGELKCDDAGHLYVAQPYNSAGCARLRAEIPVYSHRNQGDKKIFDDACFVPGTLVKTKRGDVPIEAVSTDDLVLTSKGWKRVLAAGLTGRQVETYTLTTASGKTLTGTGNHPIFTANRGVVALRGLMGEDIIYECQNTSQFLPKSLSITASSSIAIPKLNSFPTGSISARRFTIGKKEFNLFMSRYGRPLTDLYQRVATFTIATGIPITTTSPISNALLGTNTTLNISRKIGDEVKAPSNSRIWKRSERKLRHGIDQRKVENGTVSTANGLRQTLSTDRTSKNSVFTVERNSPPKHLVKSFVRIFVNGVRRAVDQSLEMIGHAGSAGSRLSSKPLNRSFVQESAVKSIKITPNTSEVYNLTVSECPEYFANGILVHNCDGERGLIGEMVVMAQEMTSEEKFDAYKKEKAPELLTENILKIENEESRSLTLAQEEFERSEFEKREKAKVRISDNGGFSDYMEEISEGEVETEGWRY